jgi:hypothetical protein
MTIDTRSSVTIARPDITAGLLDRELTHPYILHVASIMGDPAHPDGSVGRVDPGAEPTDDKLTVELILGNGYIVHL